MSPMGFRITWGTIKTRGLSLMSPMSPMTRGRQDCLLTERVIVGCAFYGKDLMQQRRLAWVILLLYLTDKYEQLIYFSEIL